MRLSYFTKWLTFSNLIYSSLPGVPIIVEGAVAAFASHFTHYHIDSNAGSHHMHVQLS